MYMTVAQQFMNQGRLKGRVEGRREGKIEGKVEGKASTVLRQVQRRFGAASAAVQKRITQADEAVLDIWSDRVLFASTLEEVLADP